MPIVAVFEFPGEEIAKYHKVFEAGDERILAQPNRLSHLCYAKADGFVVVDVWADEGSFAEFGAVIGPAMAVAGLDARPSVQPVIGSIDQAGARNVY